MGFRAHVYFNAYVPELLFDIARSWACCKVTESGPRAVMADFLPDPETQPNPWAFIGAQAKERWLRDRCEQTTATWVVCPVTSRTNHPEDIRQNWYWTRALLSEVSRLGGSDSFHEPVLSWSRKSFRVKSIPERDFAILNRFDCSDLVSK